MKLLDKIIFAFKDLMNRKLRSLLTIIAVSIGSFLLIIMMGFGDGIMDKVKDMMGNFVDSNIVFVYPQDVKKSQNMDVQVSMEGGDVQVKEVDDKDEEKKDDGFKLISNKQLKKMNKIDGVDYIQAFVSGTATGVSVDNKDQINDNFTVVGTNFDYNHDNSEDIIAGKDIKDPDKEMVIDKLVCKKLGYDNCKDIIGKDVTIYVDYPKIDSVESVEGLKVTLKVVGVVDGQNTSKCIIMSDKNAEPIVNFFVGEDNYLETKGYSNVLVYAKDGASPTSISTIITNDLGYVCQSLEMINKIIDVAGSGVKAILSIAGIIVLIVAALGLVNTISMTLQEKRKMIGVMRSVGGSRSNIRGIFIFQSIILGVAGGIFGAVLAIIAIIISNEYVTKSAGFVIGLSVNNSIIAIIITLIISIIAGLIPASKAARLNVVEAVAEE